MSILRIENLVVSYGNIKALKGISLRVEEGEVVSLIGANGAGKTTTLQTISGLLPIKKGIFSLMKSQSKKKSHIKLQGQVLPKFQKVGGFLKTCL